MRKKRLTKRIAVDAKRGCRTRIHNRNSKKVEDMIGAELKKLIGQIVKEQTKQQLKEDANRPKCPAGSGCNHDPCPVTDSGNPRIDW